MDGRVEIKVEVKVFDTLLEALPKQPPEPPGIGIWAISDEILCGSETVADAIADLLEAAGYDCVNTGYYDPDEDERNGETDRCTGWWYVTV